MNVRPQKLSLTDDNRLRITWSDGAASVIPVAELRSACPCATCREKRSAPPPPALSLTVLSPAEARPLKLLGMQPVGNYAYSLRFSDGHDTGIYTFELLRELGETAQDGGQQATR